MWPIQGDFGFQSGPSNAQLPRQNLTLLFKFFVNLPPALRLIRWLSQAAGRIGQTDRESKCCEFFWHMTTSPEYLRVTLRWTDGY